MQRDIFEIYSERICNLTTGEAEAASMWLPKPGANAKSRPLVRSGHPNEVMRVGIIELEAPALVQHVRVEPVRSK
jgi:hypothetical protein